MIISCFVFVSLQNELIDSTALSAPKFNALEMYLSLRLNFEPNEAVGPVSHSSQRQFYC